MEEIGGPCELSWLEVTMVTVWWKKGCKTSKKGIDYLDGKGVEYELRDIVSDPPPRELLDTHVGGDTLKAYLNTSSKPYRELGVGRNMPERERLIELMLEHPDLIKRPVIEESGRVAFGFDPEAIDRVVGA